MHLFWKLKSSHVFDPSLDAEGKNILAASDSHLQGLVSAVSLRPPQAVLYEKLPEFPFPFFQSLFRQVCCAVATDLNNIFLTQSTAPVSTERRMPVVSTALIINEYQGMKKMSFLKSFLISQPFILPHGKQSPKGSKSSLELHASVLEA